MKSVEQAMARVTGDGVAVARTELGRAEARGRWLIRFLATDVERLDRQALARLRDDAPVFAAVWVTVPPASRLLQELQRECRAGLAELLELRRWDLGWIRTRVAVTPPATNEAGAPDEISLRQLGSLYFSPKLRYNVSARDFRAAFLLTVAHTLEALRGRLRRCRECGAFFVAIKRQEYCVRNGKQRCSAAARMRKYLEGRTPEQLSAARHRRYAEKMRDLHGPKVKVRRRGSRVTQSGAA